MQIQSLKTHEYIFLIVGAIAVVAIAFFFFNIISTPEKDEGNEIVTVTIPDGLRKEQTADILANSLGWSTEEEIKFVVEDTARNINHAEGVLPSGTYEISTASSTYEVASMFLDRANDRYRELGSDLSPDEWYEVLKVAAIAEREASSPTEMESIAQNIWQNRYAYIQSDATVQYVRDTLEMYPSEFCNGQDSVTSGMVEYDEYVGNNGGEERTVCMHWRLVYTGADKDFDWWQSVSEADRELAHGYNTYLYEGLPQHPIATPSRESIETTLSTRDTNEAVDTSNTNNEENSLLEADFEWRFTEAETENLDGTPQTNIFLTATYTDGTNNETLVDTVDGDCSELEGEGYEGDISSTGKVQCYYAGLGQRYRITEGQKEYVVERKLFEEALPETTSPEYEWEVISAVPANL